MIRVVPGMAQHAHPEAPRKISQDETRLQFFVLSVVAAGCCARC
jgi:hypothetical protein